MVLAGQTRTRSGSRQHELVGIGADGEVALVRPEDRRQVRDPWFALVADRGALLVAATGVLEVRDERLEPVATAPAGHPFLKTFRLLAGDGAGTLLWYSPRRHQLLVSTPEDVDPGPWTGRWTGWRRRPPRTRRRRPRGGEPRLGGWSGTWWTPPGSTT